MTGLDISTANLRCTTTTTYTHTHTLDLLCVGLPGPPLCPALENSWRTMRHWSGQRWHCDELLLEAIMRIYIIPWHLASHSTQCWGRCGVSCQCWVCECSCMHVLCVCVCVCVCVCAHGIKYLSLTFSLAVHMALCRKKQHGNANLATYYYFVCECVSMCICFCATVSELEYTVIKGGRPATHVSPEGEETRHHIGGKGEGKGRLMGEEELMKERKGVVKVPKHPLCCWAGAVKTS